MSKPALDEVARWIAAAEASARSALGRLPTGRDRYLEALVVETGPRLREARSVPDRGSIPKAVSWTLAGALHGFAEAVALRTLNGAAEPDLLVDALVALGLVSARLDERDLLISAGRVYEAIVDRKLDGEALIERARSLTSGPAEAFLGRFARRPAEHRGAAIGGDVIVGPPGDRRFVPASLFPDRPNR